MALHTTPASQPFHVSDLLDLRGGFPLVLNWSLCLHSGGRFVGFVGGRRTCVLSVQEGQEQSPCVEVVALVTFDLQKSDFAAPTEAPSEAPPTKEVVSYMHVPKNEKATAKERILSELLGSLGAGGVEGGRVSPPEGASDGGWRGGMWMKNSPVAHTMCSRAGGSDDLSDSPASPYGSTVDLSSQDGVIVASVFLPIIFHRSESSSGEPVWTADWDYENLLCMSSHMRVTRVGTVKWRGWHGNFGNREADTCSPERGVPVEERHLVERCLLPFNCVPVWCDVKVFGEAYNGFCKSILWPVFHNVLHLFNNNNDSDDGSDAGNNNASNNDGQPKSQSDSQAQSHGGKGDSSHSFGTDNSSYSNSTFYDSDHAAGPIHGDGGRQAALWGAYTQINKQFSDVIVQQFNEGDLIWIHGFQLLVLPSMLSRKVGRLAKIGLFLHTPFPSSEIFRTLWCREDLLRGILNADQVGFHLYEYARHFITCCHRLLGLTSGMVPDSHGGNSLAIDTNGRQVRITCIHAGVDTFLLKKCLGHASTLDKVANIREQFKGKILMSGIDRLESFKGITLKLLGLERFLDRKPEYVGKLVLVQIGISAFERGEDYKTTKAEVLASVERVNSKYPGTIHFQECTESEMRLNQRLALLRASDILIITSVRDGLNRVPLEFSIAHEDALDRGVDNYARAERGEPGVVKIRPGICILSEFASSARVMRGSIHVNPWKVAEIAHAIGCSLEANFEEHRRRIRYDSELVNRVTTQRWAFAVLVDLKGVKKNLTQEYSGAGLGLGFRLLGMETGFKSLDTNAVAKAYKTSHKRLILLDYGGTLVNDKVDKEGLMKFMLLRDKDARRVTPQQELVSLLTVLCSDVRNIVFVVSGKERSSLTETLGNVPNLGLAAEHGMYYSWPHQAGENGRKWEIMNSIVHDRSWRPSALHLMQSYTARTHGSYIEETESKIIWQYKDAEPEFGVLQSKDLEDHLKNILRDFNVEVLTGGRGGAGGYIEVRPKGVSKGILLRKILETLSERKYPSDPSDPSDDPSIGEQKVDFALILGDDNCDEPMFEEMSSVGKQARRSLSRSFTRAQQSLVEPHIRFFTSTVGKKPSAASSFLNDVEEVYELLQSLTRVSASDNKFFSSADLTSLDPNFASIIGRLTTFTQPHQTISAGITRSVSMGHFGATQSNLKRGHENVCEAQALSRNLSDFLSHDSDDDEEDNFF